MANTTSTIGIRVVTDSTGAIKGIEQVGDKLGKLPKNANEASGAMAELDRNAKMERMNAVSDIMSGVSDKLIGFGKTAIEASAKWTALDSQWTQTWGNMESEANKAVNSIGKETSILPNRLKPAMTSIAAFAKTAGFDTAGSLDLASRATMAAADSAAFYDRSLEDTTESLKSYLKGNFENDAALGISSTETTRNAAANKLYGKSFKDLAEDQKQLTLLQMVEDGNKLSGALGQAAREGDGLENVMGNLQQAQEDFARAVGDVIQPLFIAFLKQAANAIKWLTDTFNNFPQPVKEFIVLTGALLAGGTALSGVFFAVKGVLLALGVAGLTTIGVFVAIAAGVAALVVVFKNWGSIVDKLPKSLQNVVKGVSLMAKGFKAVALADFSTDVLALRTAFTKMFPESWWDKMVDLAQVFNRTRIAIKGTYEIVKQLVFGIGDAKKFTEAFQSLDEVFGREFANKVRDTASAIGDFFRGNETGASGLSKLVDKIGAGNIAFTGLKLALSAVFGPIGMVVGAFLTLAKFLGEGSVIGGINQIIDGFVGLTSGIREASSGVSEGVGNMLMTIINVIVEFIPVLAEGAGKIVLGLAQGIDAALPYFVEAIKLLLNNITTIIIELIPVLAENGGKILTAITDGFMVLVPTFIQQVTRLVIMLLDELQKAIPQIADKATQFIETMSVTIANNLPKLIAAGTNVIVAFLKGIKDNLPRIVNAAIDVIVTWINTIGSRIGEIVNSAINLFMNFVNAILNRMDEIIDIAVRIVVTLVDGLARNADKMIGSAINLLAALINGIANNLYRLNTPIRNLVRAIVQYIVQFADSLWEGAIALLEGLAKGIRDHKDRVRSALWEVVSALGSLAFGDVLWNNGTALISGLWDGMLSMWSNVKEWVGGIADWIADHKGPVPYDKTVLVENGMALMYGLDQGLRKGFEQVQDRVSSMAEELQDNLDGSLDGSLSATGAFNSSITTDLRTANANASLGASIGSNQTIINIEGNVDSQDRINQIAEQVSLAQLHTMKVNNQWA